MGFFDRLLGHRPASEPAPAGAAAAPGTTSDAEPDEGSAASPPAGADAALGEATAARIAEIETALAEGSGDPAALREELGALHESAGDPLAAISAYEASLETRPRYGESYNRLMDLYNTQRSLAAEAGDGTAINQWMSKIDELLATSKRIMRENY